MKKITNIHLNRFLDVLNVLSLMLFPAIFYCCLLIFNDISDSAGIEFFPGLTHDGETVGFSSFSALIFLVVYVLLTVWKNKKNLWSLTLFPILYLGVMVTSLDYVEISNEVLKKSFHYFVNVIELAFLVLIVAGLVYMVKFKVQDLKQIKMERQERKAPKNLTESENK